MRSSNLAVCILTLLASVEAAPQAYGSLPVFGGPRPVPGPGSTVPSRVKARHAPAPAPVQPGQPENSGNTLPAAPPGPNGANATLAPFFPLAQPPSTPAPADPAPAVLTPAAPAPAASAPAPAEPVPAPPAPAPSAPAPAPAPAAPAPAPAPAPAVPAPAAQGRACAADIDRLASGISQNIIIQAGELSTAQSLLLFHQAGPDAGPAASNATAAESPPNAASNPDRKVAQFTALKGQLLAFVNAGVALRVSNQAITPSGSLIINGLAQVANAQQGELAMASSLSGDPTTDIATVQSLQKAFTGGRRQNGQNLLDVTQNCMPSDPTAQRTVMGALGAGLRPAVPIAVIPVSTPASTP
ncbi:hypothetical protein Vi05172_g12418 [Venturia inaequalis]|nr:hypothetical protein Vi05172_g12418 [Venturia inaequalis]